MIRGLADGASGVSLLQVCRQLSFHYVFRWQQDKGALWGPFYKGTDGTHEGSAPRTQSLPKGPTPNTIMLDIRFQHRNLGRTHSVSSKPQFSVPWNVTLYGNRVIADAIVVRWDHAGVGWATVSGMTGSL